MKVVCGGSKTALLGDGAEAAELHQADVKPVVACTLIRGCTRTYWPEPAHAA